MKEPRLKKAEFFSAETTPLVKSSAGCLKTLAGFSDFGKSAWRLLWIWQAEACKDLFKSLAENMSVC